MNRKKADAYIRSRLYRIDGLFVRSEREAALLAARCGVSARALLMRAEAASALPAEAWSGFHRALEAAQYGGMRRKLHGLTRALARHRRLAFAALVLAIAVAFFTLVPAGRAIASGIFDYVIGLSGGQLKIWQAEQKRFYEEHGYVTAGSSPAELQAAAGADAEEELESDPVYYESIAAFEETYALNAFSLESDRLELVEVYETNFPYTGKELRSTYRTAEGKALVVQQEWFGGTSQSYGTNSSFQQRQVLDGRTMYYAIDKVDGVFDGIVLLDDSILWIAAEAGVDLDLVWQLLE